LAGVVLHAADGRFSLGRYEATGEVDFGPEPVSPDEVAAHFGGSER
jgi:hypothetical protein